MSELDFRGGKIAYDVVGKGNAVVFLHGFLENRNIWKEFTSPLTVNYKIICIDLPGHGGSSNFGYSHDMEFMAEVVQAVLKFLNIRRFHLIGHSMGGYAAMAIAEKNPDSIRGICMFHSTADADSEQKKKDRLKVIKAVQADKRFFLNEAIPKLFNTDFKTYRNEIASLISSAKSMSTQGIIASLEGMRLRINREIILRFSPYPVLFIIGKSDLILPMNKLIDESSLNASGSYILLENSGHMGFIEEPELCLTAISALLKRKS